MTSSLVAARDERPLVREEADHLAHVERVADGLLEEDAHERLRERRPAQLRAYARDLLERETAERDPLEVAVVEDAEDVAERGAPVVDLPFAVRRAR